MALRAGCCHDQPCRLSSSHVPSTVYETWNRRPISVLIRARVHRWSTQPWISGPRSNSFSSRAICVSLSLGRPGDPFDRTPAFPRSRHWRRHRSTDRSLTRSAAAISRFSARPRSVARPAAESAPGRPSRRRSARRPVRISQSRATGTALPPSGERLRHHPIKFSSRLCGAPVQGSLAPRGDGKSLWRVVKRNRCRPLFWCTARLASIVRRWRRQSTGR